MAERPRESDVNAVGARAMTAVGARQIPIHEPAHARVHRRRVWQAGWPNIGFIVAALVLFYCLVHAFDPPRLNWGDSGSDYNVMIAGRNFARYGFINLRLTPNLLDRSVMTPADSGMIYTHYPQLPDLMNGVLRSAFGMSELWQFRMVALAFSFGALWFAYRLMATCWSRQTAQVGLALWLTNPLWIQHADYLHHGPYGAFFGFGSLFFLTRFFHDGRPRMLWCSGVFLFLTYCSSYDYWVFTPLLLAAMTVTQYRAVFDRRVSRTLAILAAFAGLAIAVKLAINIWALGGIKPFAHDLKFQFVERATDKVVHTSFAEGMGPVLVARIERFFSLLLLPVIAFWAFAPVLRRRFPSVLLGGVANPLPILLAALPFLIAFPELWVAQFYPGLMIVPFYAVGFAVVIVLLLDDPRPLVRLVGAAVFAAVSVNALFETARFKRAFFDVEAISTLHTQLDLLAPAGQQVLTNHVFDHFYRYYFDRNVMPLIGHPSADYAAALRFFSDPVRPQYASANGAVLVQHKHVTEELYDKGYYYILAPYHFWNAWADPSGYRRFLDSLITSRDSVLTREASRIGEKVYESDFYVLWRIPPSTVRR